MEQMEMLWQYQQADVAVDALETEIKRDPARSGAEKEPGIFGGAAERRQKDGRRSSPDGGPGGRDQGRYRPDGGSADRADQKDGSHARPPI